MNRIRSHAPDQAGFGFSQAARHTRDQPIGQLIEMALTNPNLISLAPGLVDHDSLPHEESLKLLEPILADPKTGRAALQYGPTRGDEQLRHLVYNHMARLDGHKPETYPGAADQVVITTGSQQGQHLLAEILLDPGDIVVTGWPSYFVLTGALTAWRSEIRAVEMDEHGILPEKLDDLLAGLAAINQLRRVKVVYVQSYHQNPTGRTLADNRRAQILEIVRKHSTHHRILLMEDAAYRELTYTGDAPKTILTRDPDMDHTVLMMTFSKPFSPGLRTGYMLLPKDLVNPVLRAKDGRDFGSNHLAQKLIAAAMQQGVYDKHVKTLCQTYARKAEGMNDGLARLSRASGLDIKTTPVRGGLYAWIELPPSIRADADSELFETAIEQGVLYVPGSYCYPIDPTRTKPLNTIRLSFGYASPADITEGMNRLTNALATISNKTS
ncbi:PLP-dependent aminotransferase family protein [Mucisphaera sp.]|uniref:aminotransferase-like domain-containing protein n=1 Tax=Mucisphaera sp. TaxID=2913024 RepID=UPI003D0E29A0